jgi:hypothetical protein
VGSRRSPPWFEKWTDEDEVRLEEVQSDIIGMAHMALGHMEELKKKELVLEKFNKLVAAQNEATFVNLFFASDCNGNGDGDGDGDGNGDGDSNGDGMDANGAIIQNANISSI